MVLASQCNYALQKLFLHLTVPFAPVLRHTAQAQACLLELSD